VQRAGTIVRGNVVSATVEPHPQFPNLQTVVVTLSVSKVLKGSTLDGGTLPLGWFLSSTGLLSGAATANGSYTFAIKATDSTSPPQTTRTQFVLVIADPLGITTLPTFPNACLNKPYSFQMGTSGGIPPISFSFTSFNWPGINLNTSTGIFSGTADTIGTFAGDAGAIDSAQPPSTQVQHITLNVVNCPWSRPTLAQCFSTLKAKRAAPTGMATYCLPSIW
jgi:hypothetical protein